MNNVEVTYDFIDYLKNFISREHNTDSIQEYELILDAF